MFSTSVSKLFAVVSILASTSALAKPVLQSRQSQCHPNFQGNALSIYWQPPITDVGVNEWIPVNAEGGHITLVRTPPNTNDAFSHGEFLVEFTGEPDQSYHFKMTANTAHNLALTADGQLVFMEGGATDGSQNFAINCQECPTDGSIASKCTISHAGTNMCVVGHNSGDTLTLAACDGSANQMYNFIKEF